MSLNIYIYYQIFAIITYLYIIPPFSQSLQTNMSSRASDHDMADHAPGHTIVEHDMSDRTHEHTILDHDMPNHTLDHTSSVRDMRAYQLSNYIIVDRGTWEYKLCPSAKLAVFFNSRDILADTDIRLEFDYGEMYKKEITLPEMSINNVFMFPMVPPPDSAIKPAFDKSQELLANAVVTIYVKRIAQKSFPLTVLFSDVSLSRRAYDQNVEMKFSFNERQTIRERIREIGGGLTPWWLTDDRSTFDTDLIQTPVVSMLWRIFRYLRFNVSYLYYVFCILYMLPVLCVVYPERYRF